jgi:hypothetical protein
LTSTGGDILPGGFKIRVNGEWKDTTAFIKDGTWKVVTPRIKINGTWK